MSPSPLLPASTTLLAPAAATGGDPARDAALVGAYLVVVTGFFASGYFLESFARARGAHPRTAAALSEIVRKLNHVGCGVMLALLPALGASSWPGAIIGGCVLAFLAVAAARARSTGAIDFHFLFKRPGASAYALGLVLTSLVAGGHGFAFAAAYLVLAFGDPCAHAVGKRFPLAPILGKSVGGFLAHLAVAFAVLAGVNAIAGAPLGLGTLAAVAFASSLMELITRGGWDNLTVPLTAASLLLIA